MIFWMVVIEWFRRLKSNLEDVILAINDRLQPGPDPDEEFWDPWVDDEPVRTDDRDHKAW